MNRAFEPAQPQPGRRFPRLLSTHEPSIDGNEWRYVRECLESGWVSSAGPFVRRFEDAVADYTGSGHAVATVNATSALHLALKLVGLQPGEEVLLPDLTFIAPFSAVRYCGADAVLLDVEGQSWQLDADRFAAFLAEECVMRGDRCLNRRSGRRVRAVLPVHLLGLACEIDRITAVARKYRLAVIEDAAQAIGVRYRGQHVGTFGDVGVLSFNGNKTITAGGGGALLTGNPRLAERARRLTTHAKRDHPFECIHSEIGFNYRLSNLQAAVGLAQLERLDALLARKRSVAEAYRQALGPVGGVDPMPVTAHTDPSYWLYTVRLRGAAAMARRQRALETMATAGIGARPLWAPLHRQPPARHCQRWGITRAQQLFARSISLPSSADLTPADVRRCIEVLAAAVAE